MPFIGNMRLSLAISAALLIGFVPAAMARGLGGGGHQMRAQARTSVNRPAGNSARATNVNRNANVDRGSAADRNVNRNVNTDRSYNANVNVNRNVDVDVHHDDWDHPFATAAAVTAGVAVTTAVIGSIVTSVPPTCVVTIVNNVTYQQCGSTWYQPQYYGTSVRYVVVHAP